MGTRMRYKQIKNQKFIALRSALHCERVSERERYRVTNFLCAKPRDEIYDIEFSASACTKSLTE